MTARLLILRPQPGAAATAVRAEALGFGCIVAPLFSVAPVDWVAPDPAGFDAVMMTSASAARLGGVALAAFRALPLYAVGAATAAAALDAGFGDIRTGDRDAAALIERARDDGATRLLHLAGADHIALAAPGLTRIIVYAAVERADPLAGVPIEDDMIALLHSPRAAARLAAVLPAGVRARLRIAAISAATARAAGEAWRAVAVADLPADAALLAAAAGLCDVNADRE
ncbi:uroporphyrinogen-III synthase [Sphingomonas zeicaulis]|uniref:uroporphyrinogen-III synthase n=1 Tax=Sphingomonas zeicaulis TaxID=1632740 RepID=UPI003D2497B8